MKKPRKPTVPGSFDCLNLRSALAELGCATGAFETVLLCLLRLKTLAPQGFPGFAVSVDPSVDPYECPQNVTKQIRERKNIDPASKTRNRPPVLTFLWTFSMVSNHPLSSCLHNSLATVARFLLLLCMDIEILWIEYLKIFLEQ